MITATRITRALGLLGTVGFLAHATASLATSGAARQDPSLPPEPAPAASAIDDIPLPIAPEPVKDIPPAPADPAPAPAPVKPEPPKEPAPAPAPAPVKPEPPKEPVPVKPEPTKELPAAPDEPALAPPPIAPPPAPEPLGEAGDGNKPAIAPAATTAPKPEPLPDEEPNPLPPARETKPAPILAVPPAPRNEAEPAVERSGREVAAPVDPADDPDAEARSFVERNRREAQEQLKTLREESAQLKGRLARVEAGIRRWEALADALERSAQDRTAARGEDPRAARSRGVVQYGVPLPPSGGVIIQSQPITRSDFVPVPGPR